MAPISEGDKQVLEQAKRAFMLLPIPDGIDVNSLVMQRYGKREAAVTRPMLDAWLRHTYTNYDSIMETFHVDKRKIYKRWRRWVTQAIAIYVEYWFYQPGGWGYENYRRINAGSNLWRNNMRIDKAEIDAARHEFIPVKALLKEMP